jgi:hypothetical protein
VWPRRSAGVHPSTSLTRCSADLVGSVRTDCDIGVLS